MNRIFIQFGVLVILLISLIFEKSLYGTFFIFNLIQPSLIAIIILINLKNTHTYLWVLFFYGIGLDVLNHGFIGISSLILSVSLYLFYNLHMRFDKNKIFVGILNLAFAYILALSYFSSKQAISVDVVVIAFINFLITSFIWLRK